MKKVYFAALTYLVLGLAAGVFYREFTKHYDFEGEKTQLSVVHTHLLTLGFIFLLIVLLLEKQFGLTKHGFFNPAFWLFNAGLVTATTMMVWHGIYQVQGAEFVPALSGIAGLGHIIMSLGLVGITVTLGSSVFASSKGKN